MAIANREPLLKAGRKRGSGSSVQSSISRPRSRRAHEDKQTWSANNQSVAATDEPTIEQLRQARTAFFAHKSGSGRKEMNKDTAHQGSRKRRLAARSVSSRGSHIRVRKSSRRHHSDRRHSHRKCQETESEGSTVYVSCHGSHTTEASGAAMPRSTRRVSDSVISSGKGERRRAAEMPSVYRPELRRESPLRRKSSQTGSERRSSLYVTETVMRTTKRRSVSADVAAHMRIQSPGVSRTTSIREIPSASHAPSVSQTNTLNTVRIVRLPNPKPDAPSISSNTSRSSANNQWVERRPGFLGAIFGPRVLVPDKKVECLTCLSDDVPESKSALLGCGHRMCHDCLKRIFTMSTTDPQHMPPKCCTADHIPLKHVEKLFSDSFKMKWNKKFHEYSTNNRIYCPARGCGEWIKPSNIHLDMSGGANGGRKYGKCGRCKTKVCCTCNGKWHTSRECPKDEETKRFVEVAKAEGWQRCFNCSAMVELKEGCNHMTCRCRAEFCMICGLPWKTCDCPWFSYAAAENARLQHMNGPEIGMMPVHGLAANAPGYNEELERRREQERSDEALARRMQLLGMDDDVVNGLPRTRERPERVPRRTRVRDPPPSISEVNAQRRAHAQAQAANENERLRTRPNDFWEYRIPPEAAPVTSADDDDSSFIDTRVYGNHLRYVMNRNGTNHVADADFIRRARDLMTGNRAGAEEAARDMMAEYTTANTVDGIHMPQVRPPVHPVPSDSPPLRHHSVASRHYNNHAQTRPSERVVPRRNFTDYESEAGRHRPATGVAGGTQAAAGVARMHSAMAGLTRKTGRGSGRVEEWRQHVDVNGDPSLGPDAINDDMGSGSESGSSRYSSLRPDDAANE